MKCLHTTDYRRITNKVRSKSDVGTNTQKEVSTDRCLRRVFSFKETLKTLTATPNLILALLLTIKVCSGTMLKTIAKQAVPNAIIDVVRSNAKHVSSESYVSA